MSDITPLKQFEKDTLNRRPIHLLWRDCWKWIFDEFSCSLAHQQILENEIVKWNEVVQYQKKIRTERFGEGAGFSQQVGKNGNVIDEIEYNIQAMCHFLVKNEHGFMQSTKDTLRLHQIDYKRYILCKEWFPECQDAKGKEKGQAALKANMEEFPEFYPSKKNPSRIEGFD
jgi:hypothetical protein